jgi:hypothetical protein
MLDLIIGKKYHINSVFCSIYTNELYPNFYSINGTFIKKYTDINSLESLVFEVEIFDDDYFDWLQCWCQIAINTRIKDNIFETHIYEKIINEIIPI